MKRIPYEKAIKAPSTRQEDLVLPYVQDLKNVVDMDAIRDVGLRLAVDPLGGPPSVTGNQSTPSTE